MFVDQAPLQNRAPGWELGSKGCYDEASLGNLKAALARGVEEVADGNAAGERALPRHWLQGRELQLQGCYFEASLGSLEAALTHTLNARTGCLSLPLAPDLLALLRSETLKCQGDALAELMTDHTQVRCC